MDFRIVLHGELGKGVAVGVFNKQELAALAAALDNGLCLVGVQKHSVLVVAGQVLALVNAVCFILAIVIGNMAGRNLERCAAPVFSLSAELRVVDGADELACAVRSLSVHLENAVLAGCAVVAEEYSRVVGTGESYLTRTEVGCATLAERETPHRRHIGVDHSCRVRSTLSAVLGQSAKSAEWIFEGLSLHSPDCRHHLGWQQILRPFPRNRQRRIRFSRQTIAPKTAKCCHRSGHRTRQMAAFFHSQHQRPEK